MLTNIKDMLTNLRDMLTSMGGDVLTNNRRGDMLTK